MITPEERAFFLEHGYLHARGVLSGDYLQFVQSEFDRVWELEQPRVAQPQLLTYQTFIDLIEHPPILDRQRAIFGAQAQLLEYDLLRQGPWSKSSDRYWHRDFNFPGEEPLAINTIVMLDEITEERGPTRVVPGTHRGKDLPSRDALKQPLPGEVAVYAAPGDAIFINSAIWHTGGRNNTDGLRRGIFLYYGYWWLKRNPLYERVPWQPLTNASEQRLHLLGLKMPDPGFHQYQG